MTAFRRFRTLLLRSTSAIQTHINTTEINYCLLKNRARQITKCLRNDKHALAFEPTLHLWESREVTREPHAKGHAGPKGWGNKRPPPTSRRRRTLARSLAIIAIIGVLAVIIRSMFSPRYPLTLTKLKSNLPKGKRQHASVKTS